MSYHATVPVNLGASRKMRKVAFRANVNNTGVRPSDRDSQFIKYSCRLGLVITVSSVEIRALFVWSRNDRNLNFELEFLGVAIPTIEVSRLPCREKCRNGHSRG